MERDFLIELTTKIYRLTLLFPKKDPLRYKVREAAVEVLTSWVLREGFVSKTGKAVSEALFEIEQNLNVLDSYFEIAKWQNWASFFEVLEIQKEYRKIGEGIKEEMRETEIQGEIDNLIGETIEEETLELPLDKVTVSEKKPEAKSGGLDERKKKIIEFLDQNEKAQVWELNKVLPDVTKRTLRRDFQYLFKMGIIDRIGEKNNTFYQLKRKEAADTALAVDNPISG